jgi:hypothetical protein
MSAGVGLEFTGLADIENLEIAFRISFLSTIEREIQVFPVWRPPSFGSDVGRCRDVIKYSGLRFGEAFQSQWKANFALVFGSCFHYTEILMMLAF